MIIATCWHSYKSNDHSRPISSVGIRFLGKKLRPTVQEDTNFPFVGYNLVLQEIVSLSKVSRGQAVLDLGTGTGNLAVLFARQGCRLTCADFSEAMLARARKKLPEVEQYSKILIVKE
jgi:2-polyprenyl-3-methyl-5-hydroxy-6-metoxy-1,4-benzoquinol methylase